MVKTMLRALILIFAVVCGMTGVGALAGVAFGDRFSLSVAADEACFALSSGKRLNFLDASKQQAIIDAVRATPNLYREIKEIMQRATPGCY